jgi:drug/metabolite transporter (DMT)-like permease
VSGSWARVFLADVSPMVSAAGMLSASSLVMIPAALWIDGVPDLNYSLQAVLALGYLSLIASGIAYLIFYRVLAVAGAGNTSLVTLMVAPIAIVLGAAVLGETLRPQAYAGFALLAVGLLILDGRIVALLRPTARARQ